MIISTTGGIEGRTIAGYLGVVSGDAVMGTNMFRDLFAGLRDIVGVDLDSEHLAADNRSMLMVSANGTAVKLA